MSVITHLVTGFLGAGKTTFITDLLAARPGDEPWAVLVNEFGQIGIDQVAWAGSGVAIQEVAGGCICCAQNLPLQIALGQLATRPGLRRLFIEPTGLGHPEQILETLEEPHWQHWLTPGASLCLVDARSLADPRVCESETFKAQTAIADVLLFSKDDLASDEDRERAGTFVASLSPAPAHVATRVPGQVDPAWLAVARRQRRPRRRSLLHPPRGATPVPESGEPRQPPWHYQDQALDRHVGGWVFPPAWRFAHDALLDCLLAWRGMDRVKGVFHTDKGWIFFNATAGELAIRSSEYRADSRVELISPVAPDWSALEQSLLATLQVQDNAEEQGA